jgi:hypothetical protein
MSMTEDDRRRHRLTGAQRRKVKPVSVWFIEDLLLAGQDQVWGLKENYYEYGQAAAGFEGSWGEEADRGISEGG